jgi:hypothetical protein
MYGWLAGAEAAIYHPYIYTHVVAAVVGTYVYIVPRIYMRRAMVDGES